MLLLAGASSVTLVCCNYCGVRTDCARLSTSWPKLTPVKKSGPCMRPAVLASEGEEEV